MRRVGRALSELVSVRALDLEPGRKGLRVPADH